MEIYQLLKIVDVDKLYKLLLELYNAELNDLNIGLSHNKERLCTMNELIQAIDCSLNADPTNTELKKIIETYAQI